MEAMGTIGGGALVVKKYQAGTTIANAGVPLIGSTVANTDLASVEPMTTSTALTAGSIGLSTDTSGTIAATGMSDADTLVSCIVNPDLIIRCKMNNGATEDTAMALTATSAADATGADATGTTTFDNGIVWGYDGGNAGVYRRADDTAGSMSINFPNAIGSGDNFIAATSYPCATLAATSPWPELTTLLTQMDATSATNDNDSFFVFDIEVRDASDDGQNNSFYNLIQNMHAFGSSGRTA